MGLFDFLKIKEKREKTMFSVDKNKFIKDVFDINDVPPFRDFWNKGILVWKKIYKGYYEEWHSINDPTITDENRKRDLNRLNGMKFVSTTMTDFVLNEQPQINISIKDSDSEDLSDFIMSVLDDNDFFNKLKEIYEQTLAIGGSAIKTWYNVATEKVELTYHKANQFIPINWNNKKVTAGMFVSKELIDNVYYTRIELHYFDDKNNYVIENKLFSEKAADLSRDARNNSIDPQTVLGYAVDIANIYPFIEPKVEIEQINSALFTYVKTPVANNIDDDSPLGISIFANALDTLKNIDVSYDGLINEIILGKKRIIVPTRAIEKVVDVSTGNQRRFFNPNDTVYEALSFDDMESLKISDNSQTLRIDEFVGAINANLSILCSQIGLDPGTIVFDKASGLKTATEVISENSKTYRTIKGHKNLLKKSIKDLIMNIINISILYGVTFNGKTISSMITNDIEINIYFDDSIIVDRKSEIEEGLLLVSSGVMSKISFMMKKLGMTEEQAIEELSKIKDESKIEISDVSMFGNTEEEE